MEGISQCNEALTELLTDWDNDTEPFPFEEEMIEEVMQEFYKEIIASPKKPASPAPLPSLSLSETETEPEPVVVVEAVEFPGGDGSDEFMGVNEMELAAEGDFDFDDDDDDDDAWLAAMLISWSQVVESVEWF